MGFGDSTAELTDSEKGQAAAGKRTQLAHPKKTNLRPGAALRSQATYGGDQQRPLIHQKGQDYHCRSQRRTESLINEGTGETVASGPQHTPQKCSEPLPQDREGREKKDLHCARKGGKIKPS